MNDEKLEAANELRKKISDISNTIRYYESLKKENTGNTQIRVYMTGDRYAVIHDAFADPVKNKKDGFNYIPFTPVQLMDLAIVEVKRRLDELQAEYDAL